MKIETLTKYNLADAERIRELLRQLSRSGKDKGEIPKSWFDDIIASPYHDLLVAREDPAANSPSGKILGIAALSVIMDPGNFRNAFLMDFVTDETVRGQGIGSKLWDALLDWSREKGCHSLEFTSGHDRIAAHHFYEHHGAEIYDTDYFRIAINEA